MKKILLIEDNKDVRENTAEILRLAPYEVVTAKNGKEGVELAQSEKPDLIICDIMMPVLDGHGVLHLLSKNEETSGIPFIFLTAKAERSDFRKGMEMGADDYLTKPFEVVDGVVTCPKCQGMKTWSVQKQTRSSDEPMTTFSRCALCNHQWSYSG